MAEKVGGRYLGERDDKGRVWIGSGWKAENPGTVDTKARVAETPTSGATTRGKDLGSKGKSGTGMPKQSDYSSTSEWSEAMRKWRATQDADPVIAGQKKAIKSMGGTK